MADVKLNTLPQSTSPTATQDLLLFDESTNAGQRINYNTLADVILAKLTSKTYTVAGGTQTLISAIDALNSKTPANPTVLTASDDMNNITTPGVYAQWNDNMPLHAPTTQYNATILVYNMRPYEVWQIWASANTKDVWTRMKAGGNWTDWQKQTTRAEVDKLNNALIKDYGPIGNNKTYVESFEYLANQLPAGVPIMGTYNSSGAKVFWGYLYNERNYGMFEVINYTGNRATVILDNGTWRTV